MKVLWFALLSVLVSSCALSPEAQTEAIDPAMLREAEAQVRAAEEAFARTMAERDFAAFGEFLSPDAVFFAGERPLRGAAAVQTAWQPFFADEQAPFSWAPEQVVALSGGRLVYSSGPVRDPAGRLIARFNSVWQRDADGRWRVILDKGCKACALR